LVSKKEKDICILWDI